MGRGNVAGSVRGHYSKDGEYGGWNHRIEQAVCRAALRADVRISEVAWERLLGAMVGELEKEIREIVGERGKEKRRTTEDTEHTEREEERKTRKGQKGPKRRKETASERGDGGSV